MKHTICVFAALLFLSAQLYSQCPASCSDPAQVYIASIDNDGPDPANDGCLEFVEICFHAPCDCTEDIDISGWTLEDNVTTTGASGAAEITLLIASGSLMPGECVQLISSNLNLGDGINGSVMGDMGSTISYGSTRQACPVWNNSGDGIFLFDGDEQAGATLIDSETDNDGTDGITAFTAPTDPCPTDCMTAPTCNITIDSEIVSACNNGLTPTDPLDDTFTVTVTVTVTNGSGSFTVSDGTNTSAITASGNSVIMGPYPADGTTTVSFTAEDSTDDMCTVSSTAPIGPVASCSNPPNGDCNPSVGTFSKSGNN